MSASRPPSALSSLSPETKPRTRAQKATTTMATAIGRTTRKRASTTTTTTTTTTKKAAGKATKAKPTTSNKSKAAALDRPSWKDMIKECIADNKDDARVGVSRITIKKFAEERYGVELTALNLFQLGRAIMTGAENGMFVLPKGPSGKVKIAPKTPRRAVTLKENSNSSLETPVAKKGVGSKASKKKASSVSQRNSAKKTVTGDLVGAKTGTAMRRVRKTRT